MNSTNSIKPTKKKRKRLHMYPRNLLALSGLLQVCLLQIHVDAIIRMHAVIIGFFLLAFVLTSTLNILNGFGFSTRPGLGIVIQTVFVTLLQFICGFLYTSTIIKETNFFSTETTIAAMPISVAIIALGMLSALIAIFYEVKVYRHADDIYQYMM